MTAPRGRASLPQVAEQGRLAASRAVWAWDRPTRIALGSPGPSLAAARVVADRGAMDRRVSFGCAVAGLPASRLVGT